MIQNQAQQPIEQRKIDLLIDLGQDGLHHNIAFSLARLPDFIQVVDTLAPFVHEQWGWFGVGRLDPCWEQTTLVGLEEQELVEILANNRYQPV